MAVTEDMRVIINGEADDLDHIRKSGMSFDDLTGEFSRYLAQATLDKDKLLMAKYPWKEMEKNAAYLEMLTEEHGDRINSEAAVSGATKEYKEMLKKVDMYRNVLIMEVKHIIDETNDSKVIGAFKKLFDGEREIDRINDIFPLAAIVEEHLDVAATYSPGGLDVNQGFLDLVSREAQDTLKLKGASETSDTERSQHVERQNILITLCLNAIDKIKKYAEGAFLTDNAYYVEHYSNHVFRDRYNKAQMAEKEEEEVEEVEEPETEEESEE